MLFQSEDEEDMFSLDPKDEASADFVSDAGRVLQHSLLRRKLKGKFTQRRLAGLLGKDRSFVNRCFSGSNNMTLGTFSELAWALGGKAHIDILFEDEEVVRASNYAPGAAHVNSPSTAAGDRNRVVVSTTPVVSKTASSSQGSAEFKWRR